VKKFTVKKIKRLIEKFWRKREPVQEFRLTKLKPGELIIEMREITKRFPGVLANDHIDFDLKACEIHALLGENGAGKTTLMNILYGLYRPDEGKIRVLGKPVVVRSPKDAIDLGIGMVHQHFTLIPTMSVTENIILGLKSASDILANIGTALEIVTENIVLGLKSASDILANIGTALEIVTENIVLRLKSPREPFLDIGQAEKRIAELSKMYNLKVDPKAKVEQLSIGERQRVEIIKALYRGAQVLILDEPTSVLTPQETEDFFKTLRSMVQEGLTIIFITHKLPEVMAISDRVTVLRRGKVMATIETKQTNPIDLSKKMVGREVLFSIEKPKAEEGKVVLEVKNLWALSDKGIPALKNVSFSIHEGEILGVAGVSGNGQRELAEVLTGMRKTTEGKVYVFGKDMTNRSPKKIIEQGVGHIPEDRLGMGLIMDFSVAENLILEIHSESPFSYRWFLPFDKKYFLDKQEIRKHAERLIKEYDIATPSADAPARNLSGGNLQRLILAKVLSRNPKLLVAAQPTSGLDVGATEFIRKKLMEQKEKEVAILLISEDLSEIMSLSDRIAVIYEGKIVGIIPAAKAEIKEIGLMMAGAK